MAISPEKNFVDVSKLFNWGKEVNLKDLHDNTLVSLFIRIVADEELNKARVFSLRKSAEMRRKLKTPDTDERVAYLVDKDVIDLEDVIELVIALEITDISNKVFSEVDIPFPKEPNSDATLEEQEQFQAAIDNWDDERAAEINKRLQETVNQKKKEYKDIPFDTLYKMYENFIINDVCQKEAIEQFKNYCLYASCFIDSDYEQKYFEKPEDVTRIPRELKDQLLTAYNELDISIDELKK